ncbi:MAG: transcription-repair coupling factor, partial [Raoultibacter sp.]
MLIDALTYTLEKSGALDEVWSKLDAGGDACVGVAASARPFLLAARFARRPQTTLVVVAGEEAAQLFARNLAAYVGEERVLSFPERSDYPFAPKPADFYQVARRMEALHALATEQPCLVVASARAMLRTLPPLSSHAAQPFVCVAGMNVAEMGNKGVEDFESIAAALEARGYQNTGELDGPGTFCVRGGTIDVFPGNLVYPVRLDFFGDELEEMRRIVPSTGQTIATLKRVEIFPVQEFILTKTGIARVRKQLMR